MDGVGARDAVLKSTGFASKLITTVLAVTTSGRKLLPLVVWKGANKDGETERHDNAYVVNQPNAWVDSGLLQR